MSNPEHINLHKQSSESYFNLMAGATWCANRRYFFPDIRALINAQNAYPGWFQNTTPDWSSDLVKSHHVKYWNVIGNFGTYQWRIAKQLGVSRLVEEGVAHPWAQRCLRVRRGAKELLDNNNQIDDQYITKKGPSSEDVSVDVESVIRSVRFENGAEGSDSVSLSTYVESCASALSDLERADPDIQEHIMHACTRETLQRKIRQFVGARLSYCEGTNQQYQKELRDIRDSNEPDKTFLTYNVANAMRFR